MKSLHGPIGRSSHLGATWCVQGARQPNSPTSKFSTQPTATTQKLLFSRPPALESPSSAAAGTFNTWTSFGNSEKQPLVMNRPRTGLMGAADQSVFCTSELPPLSGRWQHGQFIEEPVYHLVAGSDPDKSGALPSLAEEASVAKEGCGCREHGYAFIASCPFQVTMGLLILVNAFVIGLETDFPDFVWWNTVENVFMVIFSFELTFRIAVFGPCTYFDTAGADYVWNMFDFVVVSLGLLDFLVGVFLHKAEGGAESIFRIIRLLRILRIFRIVRFLKKLYMLAFGFALAAVAIFWVSVLMAFVLYVCSVILVRTLGQETHGHEFLHTRFMNIPTSMMTLFELMSNPDLTPYHEAMSQYPLMTFFLIGFIIFGSFGMIALLTGVISEAMFDKNQLRIEEQQLDRERSRLLILEHCSLLFDSMDQNNDGNVSRAELKAKLHKVVEFFERESLECFEEDLDTLMGILDFDKSGSINKDEFCHGILQIAEGVRPLMIMETSFSVLYLKGKMEELTLAFEQQSKDAAAERRLISSSLGELERVIRKQHADHSNQSQSQPEKPWVQSAKGGYMGSAGERAAMNQQGRQAQGKADAEILAGVAAVRDEVQAMKEILRLRLPVPPLQSVAGHNGLSLGQNSGEKDKVSAHSSTPDRNRSGSPTRKQTGEASPEPLPVASFLAESLERLAAQQQGLLVILEAMTPRQQSQVPTIAKPMGLSSLCGERPSEEDSVASSNPYSAYENAEDTGNVHVVQGVMREPSDDRDKGRSIRLEDLLSKASSHQGPAPSRPVEISRGNSDPEWAGIVSKRKGGVGVNPIIG